MMLSNVHLGLKGLVTGLLLALAGAAQSSATGEKNEHLAETNIKQAKETVVVGDTYLEKILDVKERRFLLVGAGVREKFFFDLYAVGLYTETGKPPRISSPQDAMLLRLKIMSSAVTAEKMASATQEGFEKSTQGEVDAIQDDISMLVSAFGKKIRPGDVFDLVYLPNVGVNVVKNGEDSINPIKGPLFKKALFGIWLSEHSVQDDLRRHLMAQE